MNATGSGLVYSTFIGGGSGDRGYGIGLDSLGSVLITGNTYDAVTDYPTTEGAYDTTHNGSSDVFITRLNATGSGLIYSTFIGGSAGEVGYDIAVDSSGSVLITGNTVDATTDYPTTTGAYDRTHNGGSDVFITKLNQTSLCSYAISPTSTNINALGGNGSFTLTADGSCAWTAVSNATWITVTGGNSGSGTGEITFSVAPNSLNARSGTITAGGQTFTVNQASGCVFSLSTSSTNLGAAGGSGNFSLNGIPACNWTAVSNNAWITITGASSGSGSGNVSFSVASNNGPARSGTITAGGQTFTVNQSSGCSYSFSSSSTTFAAAGGVGGFNVTTVAGCVWTAAANSGWISIDSGSGTGNGSVTFTVQPNPSSARSGTVTVGAQTFTVNQLAAAIRSPFDFDGDGKTDISVFRPSDGSWWYNRSSDSTFRVYSFGLGSDMLSPGDWTGDGKADISIWRPSTGTWYIQRSEDGSYFSFPFGASGDTPCPADYDGDGKTDACIFRPATATWFILRSGDGGTSIVSFGAAADKPVPADFDGDGKADIAVFRPSDGSWWHLRSSDATFRVFSFGLGTDRTVPGDYTGDGKADIAVWRPSTGEWFIQRSEDGSYFSFPFGAAGDIPAPGDYDGDGKTDAAVFRPSNATWYVNRSAAGVLIQGFGLGTDVPVPNSGVR